MYNTILHEPNTPLHEFCRRCRDGEEGTSLAVCIVCRRLYGTEVVPTASIISQLEYKMREWGKVWDRLADKIDTSLTKEELNEILDGKVPKRFLDKMAEVWEWI